MTTLSKFVRPDSNRLVWGIVPAWIVLIALSLFVPFSLSAQRSHSYYNVPVRRMLQLLGSRYGVSFSYDVDLVSKKRLASYTFSGHDLQSDLIALLRDTGLEFEKLGSSIVLRPASKDFYARFSHKICGHIIDWETGLPVSVASVSVLHSSIGTVTDSTGYFELIGPFVPTDDLQVRFLGYASRRFALTFFLNHPCKTIFLRPVQLPLPSVIVKDDFNRFAGVKFSVLEPDLIIIRPQKNKAATGLIPNDLLATLSQLPGVSTADESVTELNVRGGTPGQNLISLDDIPLYHFGHAFGKISSFDADLVDEIRFNKGTFSAQNGNRVSSIIDIRTKSDLPKRPALRTNINLLSAGFNAELPLERQNAGLLLSFRRSFLDRSVIHRAVNRRFFGRALPTQDKPCSVSDSLNRVIINTPKNFFYDIMAKALWKPSDKWRTSVTGLYTVDEALYNFAACPGDLCRRERDSILTLNIGLNARLAYSWRPNLVTHLSYSLSNYRRRFGHDVSDPALDSVKTSGLHRNHITDRTWSVRTQWRRNDIEMSYGYQLNTKKDFILSNFRNLTDTTNHREKTSVTSQVFFLDYRQDLTDKVHVFFGSRMTRYGLLHYKWFWEPRFAVLSKPGPHLILRMSGSVYYQTLNRIWVERGPTVRDYIWVVARQTDSLNNNGIFSIQKSEQLALGLTYQRDGVQFNASFYDKRVSGVSSQGAGLSELLIQSVGSLQAKGFEFGLQYWRPKHFATVSFTRSGAKYQFNEAIDPIEATYLYRLGLFLSGGITLNKLTLSGGLYIKEGSPYSPKPVIKTDTLDNGRYHFALHYDSYNTLRLPNYARLDLSMQYTRELPWARATAVLSVFNVLNTDNILSRRYLLVVSPKALIGQGEPAVVIRESHGMRFTPNLSLNFRFKWRRKQALPASD